jgi:hypothetical protein
MHLRDCLNDDDAGYYDYDDLSDLPMSCLLLCLWCHLMICLFSCLLRCLRCLF